MRNLKADHDKNPSAITRLQLANLRRRLYMARQMQLFGVSSLLLCVVCTFLIYIGLQMAAVYTFGVALVLLVFRSASRSANCSFRSRRSKYTSTP